jgi:hypothetical protein
VLLSQQELEQRLEQLQPAIAAFRCRCSSSGSSSGSSSSSSINSNSDQQQQQQQQQLAQLGSLRLTGCEQEGAELLAQLLDLLNEAAASREAASSQGGVPLSTKSKPMVRLRAALDAVTAALNETPARRFIIVHTPSMRVRTNDGSDSNADSSDDDDDDDGDGEREARQSPFDRRLRAWARAERAAGGGGGSSGSSGRRRGSSSSSRADAERPGQAPQLSQEELVELLAPHVAGLGAQLPAAAAADAHTAAGDDGGSSSSSGSSGSGARLQRLREQTGQLLSDAQRLQATQQLTELMFAQAGAVRAAAYVPTAQDAVARGLLLLLAALEYAAGAGAWAATSGNLLASAAAVVTSQVGLAGATQLVLLLERQRLREVLGPTWLLTLQLLDERSTLVARPRS